MLKSLSVKSALLAGVFVGLAMMGSAMGPALASAEEQESAMARDLTVAQKPIYTFGQQQFPGRMEVDAWVDNPNLTYVVGQPFRVIVRPRRDAYITIVDVGSSGRVSVLFPNHFQRESRVHGGATVMIPMDRSQWEIKVSGPPGVDLIQVIASQNPLTLPELNQLVRTTESNPLVSLGRSAEEVTRDLTAQLKPQFTPGIQQGFGVRNLLIRIVGGYGGVAMAPTYNPTYGTPNPGFGGGNPGFGGPNPTLGGPTPPYGGYNPAYGVLPSAPPSAYGLSIRTDRPAYRVGERVRILVSSRNDCRLTLVSVGPSGRVTQLFPNPYQRDNLILAGQVVMVPAANSPLQVQAQGPAGVEGLIGTCRDTFGGPTATFDAGSNGFVNLGTVQTYGRDLMANVPSAQAQDGVPAQGNVPVEADVQAQGAQGTEQTSTSYLVVE